MSSKRSSSEEKQRRRSRQRRRAQSRKEPLKVWPEKVIGAKYVRQLEKLVKELRSESAHGNRQLFLDDVFLIYLLAFFNPALRTLRVLEDFSQSLQAQKHLTVGKICRSTLSDFNRLVEPEQLLPIVNDLRRHVLSQNDQQNEDDFTQLLDRAIAVDGTFLNAVADVAFAVANRNNHQSTAHRARVDAHVRVKSWIPQALVVPEPGQSESDSAAATIESGFLYLYDRGYTGFKLIRAHYQKTKGELIPKSDFVVRYKQEGKNSPRLVDATENELSEAAVTAGVCTDRVGFLQSQQAKRAGIEQISIREVVIQYEEQGCPKTLRLLTNLHDLPAETIGQLYRQRWQVELFFRWLKTIGNFNHLISHTRDGLLAHLYVSIIGVMLMYLHTGYRPSKYTFIMMGMVAQGESLETILPILMERERQNALARESQRRRAERKKQSS